MSILGTRDGLLFLGENAWLFMARAQWLVEFTQRRSTGFYCWQYLGGLIGIESQFRSDHDEKEKGAELQHIHHISLSISALHRLVCHI